MNGFGATQDYFSTISLTAGDVVDFAVGYGSNGDYYNDVTGLDLSIDEDNTAPEPASCIHVATGLVGVLGIARRRRK